MKVSITTLPETHLVGKSLRMSHMKNLTSSLWGKVMAILYQKEKRTYPKLYSVQLYDDLSYFEKFDPSATFIKWAAAPRDHFNEIPKELEPLVLKKGLYAVFHHKGDSQEFIKTMNYIFTQWLPNSEFDLEHRPHFEVLGPKYKNDHPDSEEEIWIPIRKKHSS